MNRTTRYASLALLMVLASATPQVGTAAEPHFETAPFVGWRIGGKVRDRSTGRTYFIEPNWSEGVTLDIPVSDDFRVELRYSRQRTFVERTDTTAVEKLGISIDYYQAAGLLQWGYGAAQPYMFAGLGLSHFRVELGTTESAARPAMALGIGTKVAFADHVGLRLEFRGTMTFVSTSTGIWCNPLCNINFSTNGLWQGEGVAGLNVRF